MLCEWNSSQHNKVCVSACITFKIKRWSPILGFNFWAGENGVEMVSEAKSKEESSFHTLWTRHGQRLSFHLSFLTHAGSGSCWKEHLSCNRLANPPTAWWPDTMRALSRDLPPPLFTLVGSVLPLLESGERSVYVLQKTWGSERGFGYHYSWGVHSLAGLSQGACWSFLLLRTEFWSLHS